MKITVIKNILSCVGAACLVVYFMHLIQSDFIFNFLKLNITNLQVTLLAINTATLSIVLTKIKEIIDKTGNKVAFEATRNEMLLSIKEQVVLVMASMFIIAITEAKNFPFVIPMEVLQVCLIASFIYSIFILYDTAKSVFIILDF